MIKVKNTNYTSYDEQFRIMRGLARDGAVGRDGESFWFDTDLLDQEIILRCRLAGLEVIVSPYSEEAPADSIPEDNGGTI